MVVDEGTLQVTRSELTRFPENRGASAVDEETRHGILQIKVVARLGDDFNTVQVNTGGVLATISHKGRLAYVQGLRIG